MAGRQIEDYLADLRRRNYATTTVKEYRFRLARYETAIEKDLLEVTSEDLLAYFSEKASGWAPAYRQTIEHTIGGLYDWLVEQGRIPKSPMENIKRTKHDPYAATTKWLTTAGVRRLMRHAITTNEQVCVWLLVYTGARANAVSRLRWSDIDWFQRTITFEEKGPTRITKPMPSALVSKLREAKKVWQIPEDSDEYVIRSWGRIRGPERDNAVITNTLLRVAERAELPNVHPHLLRHSFAVAFLEQFPGEIYALQALMGHKRLSTTERYLRNLDRQDRMKVVRTMKYEGGRR